MQVNEHNAERVVRVIFGIALLSLLFILDSNWRYIGLVGIVPILTGLTGFCPLYTLLGINTAKKSK
ncbi:MAG: DUF2892 domain-containing protein [Deltaproteobacteria bacterium]|mgnify:CR=1 FL=1|nr:MAG: DUF2892 domain-containing protein [Deltaproteobacteria bacterium]